MFSSIQPPANNAQRQLLRLYRALPATDRELLLAFAQLLHQRQTQSAPPRPPQQPQPQPRPDHETVIGAIKRLSATYPMLDRGHMLDQTSALMTAHILQGRPAEAVIEELEHIFAQAWQKHRDGPHP